MITKRFKSFTPTLLAIVFLTTLIGFYYLEKRASYRLVLAKESLALRNYFSHALTLHQEHLLSLRRYFQSSQFIDRDEFRSFVTPILHASPDLLALEWIPMVEEFERQNYIDLARQDGLSGFDFKRWRQSLGWISQAKGWARQYYPVYYAEPLAQNRAALGIDLGSHKERSMAMREALATGRPISSEVVQLAQGGQGVLVFLAVNQAAETERMNLRQNRGLVLAVYKLDDFFDKVMSEQMVDTLLVEVYSDESQNSRIFSTAEFDQSAIVTEIGFPFYDLNWRLKASPTQRFEKSHQGNELWYLLVLGVFFIAAVFRYNTRTVDERLRVEKKILEGIDNIADKNERLQNSEARHRAISSVMMDAVVTIDEQGLIQEFNPAAEQIFGYRAEAVIGSSVNLLMPEPINQSHDEYLRHYLESRIPHILDTSRDVIGRRSDDSLIPLNLRVTEQHIGDSVIFVGVLHDLTQEHNLLERQEAINLKLDASNQELARANKDLEQFAYVASHDLRAPLRAIENLAQWVVDDMGEQLDGENLENMQLLLNRVGRLDELMVDLLEYSRVGRTDRKFEELDCYRIVIDVVDLLAPPERVTIQIDETLPTLTTNRAALELVIRNLIGNAIKHNHGKAARIEVSSIIDDRQVVFSIADDGDGIKATNHERIFDLFTSLKSHDEVEGSGMGLAICRRAAESLGGKIWIDAEYDKGARFCFSVPISSTTLQH